MGSRLFSNTTNLLGGHDFANPDHRAKVARVLGIPEERIPSRPSWAYDQIIEGIEAGKIRGLWVIGTNPAHSWINQGRFRDILDRLDFLVVQDMYHSTETAQLADLLLPAAALGREGGHVHQLRAADRADQESPTGAGPGPGRFSHFQARRALLRLRPDVRRVGVARGRFPDSQEALGRHALRHHRNRRLPHARRGRAASSGRSRSPGPTPAPQRRLFADGRFYHPDGRARFIFEEPRPTPEPPGGDFPFQLLTGRGSAAQWHTQTRTAKSDVLRKLAPQGPLRRDPSDRRDGPRACARPVGGR